MANVTGWGRGTWGQDAWNQAIPVTVTGVSATVSVGNVIAFGSIDGVATGVVASGLLNSVSSVTGTAVISPTGVVGTSALGEETTNCSANVTGVGVTATVSFGDESVAAGAKAVATGNAATSALGTTTQAGGSVFSATGNVGTSSLGTVAQISKYPVTGVTATGNTGIVLVYTDVTPIQTPNWVAVAGVSTIWTDETPSQAPSWTEKAA